MAAGAEVSAVRRPEPPSAESMSGHRSDIPRIRGSCTSRSIFARAGPRQCRLEQQLDEIAALITAAGGRTLGLFSSVTCGQGHHAEVMSTRLDTPVLCQGEDSTATLVWRFADDAETSLFGTLSL